MQEAQATITSSEFVEWLDFLEWHEWHAQRREDYYHALIAAVMGTGKGKRINVDRWLLKFGKGDSVPAQSPEERVARSKAFWRALGARPTKEE